MGPGFRRLAIAILAVLAAATALAPGRALAHAALVHADPADGAMLAAAPSRLVLHFSEAVTPLAVRIIDSDGEARALPLPAAAEILSFDAPALATGTYALSWRVISEDGHPVGGSLLFTIGTPPAGQPLVVMEMADPVVRAGLWGARLLMACGLLFGVGAVLVRKGLGAEAEPRSQLVAAALVGGVVGSLLLPGLQGLDALDLPWTAITEGLVWRTGAGTSYGATAVLAGVACLVGLAAWAARGRGGKALVLVALGLAVLAPAASGHAASAAPRALMTPAVVLHVLAAALWLGALVPLAGILRRRDADLGALRRLSAWLPAAVALLIASGAVLAVVQVQAPAALLDTAYGRVLLAKLAAVAGLLALAAANRWLWTDATLYGYAGARRRLSRAVVLEIGLGLLVLGIVGMWRFTPPPRVLAAERAAPVQIHIHTDQAMADLTLAPGHAGPVDATLVIMTGDFGPLDAKEVTLAMSRPDLGLEPVTRLATRQADGTWTVRALPLPVAGRWRVGIRILVDDFHLARLDGEMVVKP